jgi:dual specificity phosphatase 3
MSHQLLSIERPVRPDSPYRMWRQLCWLTDQIVISGDLSSSSSKALEQLRTWEDAGITDVFDMRGECDDTHFIEQNSSITSHWFGVDDNGTARSDDWFVAFVETALEVLSDPNRKILVHCHMGVNRGPSAAYAILLALGWDHLDALRAIRTARPIAGIIYAVDAVNWWMRDNGSSPAEVEEASADVEAWLERNPLDLHYVIGCIGNRIAV